MRVYLLLIKNFPVILHPLFYSWACFLNPMTFHLRNSSPPHFCAVGASHFPPHDVRFTMHPWFLASLICTPYRFTPLLCSTPFQVQRSCKEDVQAWADKMHTPDTPDTPDTPLLSNSLREYKRRCIRCKGLADVHLHTFHYLYTVGVSGV